MDKATSSGTRDDASMALCQALSLLDMIESRFEDHPEELQRLFGGALHTDICVLYAIEKLVKQAKESIDGIQEVPTAKTQPTLRVVPQNAAAQQRERLASLYDDMLMIDSLAAVLSDALAGNEDPQLIHYGNAVDIIRTQLKAVYMTFDELKAQSPPADA